MEILWPASLILLGIIPLLVGAYIWRLRRRQRNAVRFSSLSIVREAMPQYSRLRRYLPAALFMLAVSSLIVGFSRPVSVVKVPAGQVNVILAMDVSLSMCSTDIPPNRLEVAKKAADSFIQRQPPGLQTGIVAFAGFAELLQPPTKDQEALKSTIESLRTARRTAIGSAILTSLDALAEANPNIPPSGGSADQTVPVQPLPEGKYAPDIIVLLTDGASNAGPEPILAAQEAANRGIRVYTIGFGSDQGGMMDCGSGIWGWTGPRPGGGGGGNDQFLLSVDEGTLKQISSMTGGEYYSASSASELNKVFEQLPTYYVTRDEKMEVSVYFAAFGALLVFLATTLSLLWSPLTG